MRSLHCHKQSESWTLDYLSELLAAPSAGFEPAHTAPEADALSSELRGHTPQELPNVSGVASGMNLKFAYLAS